MVYHQKRDIRRYTANTTAKVPETIATSPMLLYIPHMP
jgi:hypothetical protein